MRRTLALALGLALATAAPAAAEPVTETADAPGVHAELSYDRTTVDDVTTYANLILRVSEGGVEIVSSRIEEGFVPGGYDGRPSVRAVDLDRDGHAEVLLDLYSGGAHCCLVARLYDGRQMVERDFRDPGYELVRRGGRYWFKTGDVLFVGAYGAYAYSRLPLQLLSYTGTRLEDVTRAVAWRRDIERHAARYLRDYRRVRRHPRWIGHQHTLRAALAAYAADQCSLGDCRKGLAPLRRAVRRGEIVAYGRPGADPGQAFLHDVRRDLRRGGYIRWS